MIRYFKHKVGASIWKEEGDHQPANLFQVNEEAIRHFNIRAWIYDFSIFKHILNIFEDPPVKKLSVLLAILIMKSKGGRSRILCSFQPSAHPEA